MLVSLAVLCACSPVEGQEETLLGAEPNASPCVDVVEIEPANADEVEHPGYADSEADRLSVVPDTDSKAVEVYDPETGITYPAVIVRCVPVTGAQGEFLSGDEPDYPEQLQLLTGF